MMPADSQWKKVFCRGLNDFLLALLFSRFRALADGGNGFPFGPLGPVESPNADPLGMVKMLCATRPKRKKVASTTGYAK